MTDWPMTDWPRAFRRWMEGWRGKPLSDHRAAPEWHAAYRKAFRAGWRAAMRQRMESVP